MADAVSLKGFFSFRYNKIYPIVTPAMYRNKMSWLAKISFWLPTNEFPDNSFSFGCEIGVLV